VCIDLTSEEAIDAGLRRVQTAYGARIASVIHLAAYFDLTGEPNPLYEEITVRGTGKLRRGLQAFEVEQFVLASSMLAHKAGRPGDVIDEGSATVVEPAVPNFQGRSRKLLEARSIEVREDPIARLEGTGDQLQRIVFAGGEPLSREIAFMRPPNRQHGDFASQLGCTVLDDGSVEVYNLC
jgi:hypothetical protein